jgi:transcriptional regulator with XRE-family HTH domain
VVLLVKKVGISTFQLAIKELRESNGFTQQALADALGISKGAVGNWEAGTREPNLETIKRISNLFGITSDYLVGLSSAPVPQKDKSVETEAEKMSNTLENFFIKNGVIKKGECLTERQCEILLKYFLDNKPYLRLIIENSK